MNLSILAFNIFFLLAAAGLVLALILAERRQRISLTLTSCLGSIAILDASAVGILIRTFPSFSRTKGDCAIMLGRRLAQTSARDDLYGDRLFEPCAGDI